VRKIRKHVGHFVAALPAADVDDHVGVAPLRNRVLGHGLARAEASGDGGCSALGNREKNVDYPLPCDKGRVGGKPLGARPGNPRGPPMRKRYLPALAGTGHNGRHSKLRLRAKFGDAAHMSRRFAGGGNHDLAGNAFCFLDRTKQKAWIGRNLFAARNFCNQGGIGNKGPLFTRFQRLPAPTGFHERPVLLKELFKRALNAVVNISNQTGPQKHGQRAASRYSLGSYRQPGLILINLDYSFVLFQPDNFPDELFIAYFHNVEKAHPAKPGNADYWPGNALYTPPNNMTVSHTGLPRQEERRPIPPSCPLAKLWRRFLPKRLF